MKYQSMTDALTCLKGPLECIRYFPGQLITPAEMTQEQDYFRQKLRLHNRMLHGWGVVCGALVCAVSEADENNRIKAKPWHVKVKPGYILGPYGDDIVIDCTHEVDLRTNGLSGVTGEACEQALDPWCSEVTVKRDAGPLYIAVKYKQTVTRPVRVQPVGCGCDETQCEYSRCRDGYEICILDECPESHQEPPDLNDLFNGGNPPCPDCPTDPWVVLAKVVVGEDGTIEWIDNCSCRRLVIALGRFWWKCEQEPRIVIDNGMSSNQLVPGSTHTLEVFGDWQHLLSKNIQLLVTASATVDIFVTVVSVSAHRIEATINIPDDAMLGVKKLKIIDEDTDEELELIENAIDIIKPQTIREPKSKVKKTLIGKKSAKTNTKKTTKKKT